MAPTPMNINNNKNKNEAVPMNINSPRIPLPRKQINATRSKPNTESMRPLSHDQITKAWVLSQLTEF